MLVSEQLFQFYLPFNLLEVVSRCRDPQSQVVENYSYLFNLRPNITNIDVYTVISFPIDSQLIKRIKNDYCCN